MKRWSLVYEIGKFFMRWIHRFFYQEIVIEGSENIPNREPIIFASNHQNALMDPTVIIFATKKQPVFLTRGDIFANPIVRYLLGILKSMPIFRIRDGKESLKKNDKIFNQTMAILENNNSIGIFPEATHTDKRRLRKLQKGVPRIAFLTEEKHNFKLGVKIIPVGIYYSDYEFTGTIIHIQFGEPIKVTDYQQIYSENPQKAMNILREDLTQKIIPLMIHIKSVEYYDMYNNIRNIYQQNMFEHLGISINNQQNKFISDKKIISEIEQYEENNPAEISVLNAKVLEYIKLQEELKIPKCVNEFTEKSFFQVFIKGLLLFVLSPLEIYARVNFFHMLYASKLILPKIKDTQFRSSIKYGMGVLLSLLMIVQIVIVFILVENSYIEYGYLLSLIISIFEMFYFRRLKYKYLTEKVIYNLQKNNDAKYKKLLKFKISIVKIVDDIIN